MQSTMRLLKAVTYVLLSLVFTVNSWAQVGPDQMALKEVIQAARNEARLDVMWGPGSVGGVKGLAALQQLVNKRYNVNLKFTLTIGPSQSRMGARILQEKLAGRNASSDVFVGSENHLQELYRAHPDVFLPVKWRFLFPHMVVEDIELNSAVRIQDGIKAFVYNTNLVPPKDIPQRFEDLLKPKWSKRLAGTTNATGLNLWTYLVGEKRGIPAVETFCQDYVRGLIRSTEFERIASGEFPIMAFSANVGGAQRLKEEGAPLDYIHVIDAPFMTGSYLVVPRNSAHPNVAKLLISVMHTKEGQDLLWDAHRTGTHRLKGTKYAAWFKQKFAGVKFFVTTAELLLNNERLAELGKRYRETCRG